MSKGKHNHACDPIVFSHLCVLMKKLRNCLAKCEQEIRHSGNKEEKGEDKSPRKSRKAELNQVVRGKNLTAKQGRISSVLKVH